jgi:hypothetical protein
LWDLHRLGKWFVVVVTWETCVVECTASQYSVLPHVPRRSILLLLIVNAAIFVMFSFFYSTLPRYPTRYPRYVVASSRYLSQAPHPFPEFVASFFLFSFYLIKTSKTAWTSVNISFLFLLFYQPGLFFCNVIVTYNLTLVITLHMLF